MEYIAFPSLSRFKPKDFVLKIYKVIINEREFSVPTSILYLPDSQQVQLNWNRLYKE